MKVEINTTKADKFFYNPLWGEPEVCVNEVEDVPAGASDDEAEEADDTQEGLEALGEVAIETPGGDVISELSHTGRS